MKLLCLFSLFFLFACQKTKSESSEVSDQIAKDAASMEKDSEADCEDKVLDGASAESDDLFKANTGCSIDEE